MRKLMLVFMTVVMYAVLVGCTSKTDFSYAPVQAYESANTMVYNSNINKVWDAAIKSIGEKFFVLDNIQKDSKIITLSYSVSDPAAYIDCGQVTAETKGASNSGTYTYQGAQAEAVYYIGDPNIPHPQPVRRTARLEGKVNIIFVEEGKDKTKVTVNTRYVMSVKFESRRWVPAGYFMPVSESRNVTFNTGQEGVGEGGSNLRCVTKYTLEKSILEGIKDKL